MPCIHGFDEINCPTCRIIRFTIPKSCIKIESKDGIRPNNSFSKLNLNDEDKLYEELKTSLPNFNKNITNLITTPRTLNNLPNFENKMLLERLDETDISKSNIFKFSKKTSLANPELELNKK